MKTIIASQIKTNTPTYNNQHKMAQEDAFVIDVLTLEDKNDVVHTIQTSQDSHVIHIHDEDVTRERMGCTFPLSKLVRDTYAINIGK